MRADVGDIPWIDDGREGGRWWRGRGWGIREVKWNIFRAKPTR